MPLPAEVWGKVPGKHLHEIPQHLSAGSQRSFERLEREVAQATARLGAATPTQALSRERDAIFRDEIHASTHLCGVRLSLEELYALLERDQVLGAHRFSEYQLASGYAAAASYVAAQTPIGPRKPRAYLRLDEILELHIRVTTGASNAHAGAWRATTLPAFPGGLVSPPPWKLSYEMSAFVDRFAAGPAQAEAQILWIAQALKRFARLQPFAAANGRMGRLIVNLLLQRLDLPPFIVPLRGAARYRAALGYADANDLWPLAAFIAASLLTGLTRLVAACETSGALLPLATIAASENRRALYKASQRGRLRTVRRNGNLFTTSAWLEAYYASRSPAGRRSNLKHP